MLNKVVFKALRGEGKTKWLVTKATDAEFNGIENIRYVGSPDHFTAFKELYEVTNRCKCKIKYWNSAEIMYPESADICVLTDDVLNALDWMPGISPECSGTWYMTIDSSAFIN